MKNPVNLVLQIHRPQGCCLFPVAHDNGIPVKMAVFDPKRTRICILGAIERVSLADVFRRPPFHTATQRLLQRIRLFRRLRHFGIYDHQVTFPPIADVWRDVVDNHLFFEVLQGRKGVLGNSDIVSETELDTGIAHGKRTGGLGIGRVALHHRQFQGIVTADEVKGDGTAHDATANDHYIVGFRCHDCFSSSGPPVQISKAKI